MDDDDQKDGSISFVSVSNPSIYLSRLALVKQQHNN